MFRLKQFLIAIDQCFNVVFGSGYADETLSAYFWRTQDKHPYAWQIIDAIFFFDPRHCYESYRSEQLRSQLPPEYR